MHMTERERKRFAIGDILLYSGGLTWSYLFFEAEKGATNWAPFQMVVTFLEHEIVLGLGPISSLKMLFVDWLSGGEKAINFSASSADSHRVKSGQYFRRGKKLERKKERAKNDKDPNIPSFSLPTSIQQEDGES